MNCFLKISIVALAIVNFSTANANDRPISNNANLHKTRLVAELPLSFNSPASFALDSSNNILFTSPNLHNDLFLKQGLLAKPAVPVVGLIDKSNKVSTWYEFQPQDMETSSHTVVPMGIAKGPDGNMYVADMQLWAGGESRILRINVKNGKAQDVDIVATGLSFPNALAWKGNDLFISDTVLSSKKGKPTISGVYRIKLKELNSDKPLKISSFKRDEETDTHLIKTFESDGSLGFGANGLAIDDSGSLYVGIMEEGTIYKTILDSQNNPVETVLFTKGLVAPDGIQWDSATKAMYITDLFTNSVYSIQLNGELTLLAQNDDTTGVGGLLDAPGEAIVRGKEVFVNNFDAAFNVPSMVNTTPDAPVTISVFSLD
ncbi:NHL repeat-containing protein [Shewanella marisflavi]|uniref:SMP-30/Gluconolactonase/LRE-like region domain-containing protein n=1 Tax=Shewanella marisflavi TaxID=260364 RepID=A0AAC9TY74_9GAMM|nr:SMP-30/gluconolactonase/LRE family protein [Shewanella marisflavi]ASJ95928.1 hypothetical protein CFF01_04620 [Shewanella marisflavi]